MCSLDLRGEADARLIEVSTGGASVPQGPVTEGAAGNALAGTSELIEVVLCLHSHHPSHSSKVQVDTRNCVHIYV